MQSQTIPLLNRQIKLIDNTTNQVDKLPSIACTIARCLMFCLILELWILMHHLYTVGYHPILSWAQQNLRTGNIYKHIMTTGLILGVEAEFFLWHLGEHTYDCQVGASIQCHHDWIRARLSFAILQATMLCVHGSHTMCRCLGILDGGSLPLITD